MLDPADRCLLLQSLRPPPGFRLDAAVGTSYTLDLMALLTAPLAFTFFEYEEEDGRPSANPLAIFEAARRHAQRMHIFCHGGGIKVPPANRRLLPLVEDCVIQVLPPTDGAIFHPKVWLLRFEGDDGAVHYRFLCLSRNLTFERSWDTALVLDGEYDPDGRARTKTKPLANFIRALPGWALGDIKDDTRTDIERMATELAHVRFRAPDGFLQRGLRFHPLGLGDPDDEWPLPDDGGRALVMSPFLSNGLLDYIAENQTPAVLISRPDTLHELKPETLAHFENVYVLDDDAESEATDEAGHHDQQGLHAKLYVIEGWPTHVFTGSANATTPAFDGSIEFLVELTRPGTVPGIELLLGPEAKPNEGLQRVLTPWNQTPRGLDPEEALRRRLEGELDVAARTLLRAGLTLHVDPLPDDTYTLRLMATPDGVTLAPEITLSAWPASIGPAHAREVQGDDATLATFSPVSFPALTAFMGFRAELTRGGVRCESKFVLRLPLVGAPEDRRERLLRDLIQDREHLLQLIALLLAREGVSVRDLAATNGDTEAGAGGGSSGALPGVPLLEGLLDAIDSDPERLDDVAALIADLSATERGRELMPPGLEALIAEFAAVRAERAP